MLRAVLRGAWDFGRVLAAEVIEYGSQWAVARLTDGEQVSPAEPLPEEDVVRLVSDEEMNELALRRESMRARQRPPLPAEEPPPEPLVGSLEWRSRQARGIRPR